jgi:tetratricopeptide (TPR) repeat protein
VFEGTVFAANDQGSVSVSGGEAASASADQAPQARTLLRPRDAAQWSLYYPPVFATGGDQAAGVSSALQQAASDLAAGRVDQARPKLDQAIAEDTDAGLAYALRAVINVVQNQLEAALTDANQAVALNPDSAATHVALSYAQQAGFQIDEARDTLLRAVEKQPEDALAWARLAELQLMLGNKQQATEAAQKAVTLAPDLGRTQITLGFAALVEFRAGAAQAAFEKAITLDSADPLPRLGLGLARISMGELERGRSDIEAAVALGSNDALLRAYLGKAYFEEKRAPLDSEQFAIAKQLDPNDPTAFLYDGIAKQTQNRPVEALQDLEKSILLNENRAVYRGRLLLDKDRAARGTSQARVYNDLGFSALGFNEATQSLSIDPANASAHRFLSDTYNETSGRVETARVSELLQSQLLQDLNLNPVQPSVSSTNLNVVTAGGPAEPGFNEYTPLFERNETRFDITGFGGENDTSGGEAVLSSVYNSVSGSVGYFDYDTDGFRENNNLDHEIWDVYGQWAVSSVFNVQAEYRERETKHGDLRQSFDLDDYDPTFLRESEEKVSRLGARISTSQQSDILMSLIRSELDSTKNTVPLDEVIPSPIPGFPDGFIRTTEEEDASSETEQFDLQYIFEESSFNLVTGASYSDSDSDNTIESITSLEIPPIVPPTTDPPLFINSDSDTNDKRIYAYADWTILPSVTGTIGFSYVDFESDVTAFEKLSFDEFNPKLGLRWDISNSLQARAAYFKNVMPVMASKRTLEPTQVAGFNQFYDDPNATKSTRYGVAVDWQPSVSLAFGAELTRRDVESPVLDFNNGTIPFEDIDEWDYRGYGYWTPSDQWSLSLEATYDKFENESNSLVSTSVPKQVTTKTFPAKVTYFHPSGLFVGITVTNIDQEVRRESNSFQAEGDDNFTLTDLSVGYRLPKRRGVASLTVQNLFDEDFKYQDESYRTFSIEPYVGPYIPETTVMGRFTLSF